VPGVLRVYKSIKTLGTLGTLGILGTFPYIWQNCDFVC